MAQQAVAAVAPDIDKVVGQAVDAAASAVHRVADAAVAKAEPSLSAEVIAKISEVVEARMRPPAR